MTLHHKIPYFDRKCWLILDGNGLKMKYWVTKEHLYFDYVSPETLMIRSLYCIANPTQVCNYSWIFFQMHERIFFKPKTNEDLSNCNYTSVTTINSSLGLVSLMTKNVQLHSSTHVIGVLCRF
jgi:hypothetical protein